MQFRRCRRGHKIAEQTGSYLPGNAGLWPPGGNRRIYKAAASKYKTPPDRKLANAAATMIKLKTV
jgi:hypothetical protein